MNLTAYHSLQIRPKKFLSLIDMLRRVYILLFLIYTSCFLSQNNFSFTISDLKTKEPIPFSFTIIKGKTTSALSNENGVVNIPCSDSDSLIIYQLGYNLLRTAKIDIEKKRSIVYLTSKDVILDEVVVTSKQVDTFMYKNDVSFIDFEFYDDHILALAARGGRFNSLMILDINGNKLTERKLHFETDKIFKDCFGNLHLIAKDSIYQVYFNYQEIALLPPFHIRNYYAYLKPCECIHFNTYIFKQKQYKDLKDVYFMINEDQGSQKHMIATVADSVAIKGFNMDFDINYFLGLRRNGMGYATSVTELTKHIDELREDIQLPPNYLLAPVRSEMKKLANSFVLFDYTNKWVHTFSLDGKPYSKLPFVNAYDLKPELYIDHDVKRYIFTSVNKNGLLTLYRYEPLSNTFTHKFELPSFPYAKGSKVKGNTLYFIYKDRKGTTTKTKIIKQNITWQKL